MAATHHLPAHLRSTSGKGPARKLRTEGLIPGIVYGGGEVPQSIALPFREMNQRIYAGRFLNTLFELDLDGKKERVIPRDYQLDVVTDGVIHVDFMRLKPGAQVRLEVPVHFINQELSPGLKRGGALNIVRHSIEMFVPADDIPEFLTIDLTGLEINESVHISNIKIPEGCRPTIRDRDFTILSIAASAAYKDDTPAASAGAEGKAPPGKAAPAKAASAKAAPSAKK